MGYPGWPVRTFPEISPGFQCKKKRMFQDDADSMALCTGSPKQRLIWTAKTETAMRLWMVAKSETPVGNYRQLWNTVNNRIMIEPSTNGGTSSFHLLTNGASSRVLLCPYPLTQQFHMKFRHHPSNNIPQYSNLEPKISAVIMCV